MKTKIIYFVILVLIAGAFISTKTILAADKGPNEGRIQKVGNNYIEVKKEYVHFFTFLLDEQKNEMSNANMSCEIRFFLSDGSTLDIPLAKHGTNGFVIDYFANDYNSYRVTFEVAGKYIGAKFENENLLVKGE